MIYNFVTLGYSDSGRGQFFPPWEKVIKSLGCNSQCHYWGALLQPDLHSVCARCITQKLKGKLREILPSLGAIHSTRCSLKVPLVSFQVDKKKYSCRGTDCMPCSKTRPIQLQLSALTKLPEAVKPTLHCQMDLAASYVLWISSAPSQRCS